MADQEERRSFRRREEDRTFCPLDRTDCPRYREGVEEGLEKPIHGKEPLFTSFAGKLIAVLVTIILGMAGYWMHHVTSMATENAKDMAQMQQTQAQTSTELRLELRSIAVQLSSLNAQVTALGEFAPRNGGRPPK